MHLLKIEITKDENITTTKVAIAKPKALMAEFVMASNGHKPKSWHRPGLFDQRPFKKTAIKPSVFTFFLSSLSLTPSTVFYSLLHIKIN